MDNARFDAIARLFAARRSRRAAPQGGAAGLAAATVAAPFARRLTAQDATPAATPEVTTSTDPHPNADAPAKTEMLFVQPFESGAWAPKAGDDGVYTLTLTGAAANTVYFSDRPERIFGIAGTQEFLDGLGFTPANPPNAALVARNDGGEEDVLVIELLSPAYDAAAATLTYDARVLADYGEEGLAHAARQQSDSTLPERFAEGGLFIDGLVDCDDGCATCYSVVNGVQQNIGLIDSVGRCSHSPIGAGFCAPCNDDGTSGYYGRLCNEAYPAHCMYRCDGTSCSWDCYATKLNSCDPVS